MMFKTEGLLTIIVPCYNGEAYIQRCTASLAGLRDDISVLFVNDGSTDTSAQLIEEWTKTRPNAFLLTKPNGGYATAINFGLEACGSEYVMFLGVDDEIVVDGIHQVAAHLEENRPDILAFTTVKMFDDREHEQVRDLQTVYRKTGYFETDLFSLYEEHTKGVGILFTRDTSRCFKMSCIGKNRYFGKIGVSADGCFSILVATQARSFEFLNVDGYIWHLHTDSVSSRKKTIRSLRDEASVWDAFFSHLQENFPHVAMPLPVVSYAYAYRQVVYALSREDKEYARKHAKKAKTVYRWLLKSRLPFAWRCKLRLSRLCRLWLRLRRRA